MEVSRRTDYAIRLMSALVAAHGEPLSVRTAAASHDVPYSFARTIQQDLMVAGMVYSLRGAHGGMILACDPKELTLLDIVEAIQGPISVSVCSRTAGWCPRERHCAFHPVWQGADLLLRNYLGSVSLYDLVEGVKSPTVDPSFAQLHAFDFSNPKSVIYQKEVMDKLGMERVQFLPEGDEGCSDQSSHAHCGKHGHVHSSSHCCFNEAIARIKESAVGCDAPAVNR